LSRRSRQKHCSGLQEAPQFATPWVSSCPTATRYNLTPQHSISTTACSAVLRQSQYRSNQVGCLELAGSLTSHTVWSRSGRSSTRVMPIARASMSVLARARQVDSLACAPVTPLSCGLLLCALMYHAVLGCCTKHMQQPPPSLFPLPLQPRKPRLGKLSLSRAGCPLNFYASSRPPDPRALFSIFCLWGPIPTQEIRILTSTPDPRALGREVQHACLPSWIPSLPAILTPVLCMCHLFRTTYATPGACLSTDPIWWGNFLRRGKLLKGGRTLGA